MTSKQPRGFSLTNGIQIYVPLLPGFLKAFCTVLKVRIMINSIMQQHTMNCTKKTWICIVWRYFSLSFYIASFSCAHAVNWCKGQVVCCCGNTSCLLSSRWISQRKETRQVVFFTKSDNSFSPWKDFPCMGWWGGHRACLCYSSWPFLGDCRTSACAVDWYESVIARPPHSVCGLCQSHVNKQACWRLGFGGMLFTPVQTPTTKCYTTPTQNRMQMETL